MKLVHLGANTEAETLQVWLMARADLLTSGLCGVSDSGRASFVLRYVQMGFIERQRFNEMGMAMEDLSCRSGHFSL